MPPILAFGEYRPDASDVNGVFSNVVNNVLPRSDGYGPFKDISELSSSLGAACRGYFFARKSDGSIQIFAGTSTKLYTLDNTTFGWTDVSLGASTYTTLSSNAHWQFAQFNNFVIAVQAHANPQVFDITSSTAFADLGGSPPQAAYIAIINRFVVLSGLSSFPYRIQWSGLNDVTQWTSGVNGSDYQDLPDGGRTAGVVGGEIGVIMQDSAIRRMTFSPGSAEVFDINRIGRDIGTIAPYSIVNASERIFFLSAKGFMQIDETGGLLPIGKERVDRTFFGAYDDSQPQLIIGAVHPTENVVFFTYKSAASGDTTKFDKILAFDYLLNRWTPIDMQGEFIASLAKPGVTLEGLDTIGSITVTGAANNGSGKVRLAVTSTTGWTTGDVKQIENIVGTTEANGTFSITVINSTHIDLTSVAFVNAYVSGGFVAGSIDALTFSLDDLSTATLSQISMFTGNHKLGFFDGDNLEATLAASEQSAVAQRVFVRGFYPITDSPTVYGKVSKRENLFSDPVATGESLINAQGFIPLRASTRFARPEIRIPAGTAWTFATGLQPDYSAEGSR